MVLLLVKKKFDPRFFNLTFAMLKSVYTLNALLDHSERRHKWSIYPYHLPSSRKGTIILSDEKTGTEKSKQVGISAFCVEGQFLGAPIQPVMSSPLSFKDTDLFFCFYLARNVHRRSNLLWWSQYSYWLPGANLRGKEEVGTLAQTEIICLFVCLFSNSNATKEGE